MTTGGQSTAQRAAPAVAAASLRRVLTVVYGAPDRSDALATRLWMHAPSDEGIQWEAPAAGQLLLWAGEGLEIEGLAAIEHCVRVDPEGPYIEHSHERRDPEAPSSGNRRSVALVLDE
ncbi:unnamed protein product [Polarella glacialis]|uniref:Uncharacterized protein n=1 Tax=Polarella glacialis TaxID=89957 RepID=A0A813DEJ6_POLGL|nr:unnamed protein product [Polarella glacialis]